MATGGSGSDRDEIGAARGTGREGNRFPLGPG